MTTETNDKPDLVAAAEAKAATSAEALATATTELVKVTSDLRRTQAALNAAVQQREVAANQTLDVTSQASELAWNLQGAHARIDELVSELAAEKAKAVEVATEPAAAPEVK